MQNVQHGADHPSFDKSFYGWAIMIHKNTSSNVTMHKPAIYRIRIRGRLTVDMSDQISGMQITEVSGENGKTETILVGRLVDQAALSGVLNSLYELHLPVLSADCVDADS
jgi:hypothetical protein